MTNEDLVEEIYWSAHQHGVFEMFYNEVNNHLKKTTINDKSVIVEKVYYEYRKRGLIGELNNIN